MQGYHKLQKKQNNYSSVDYPGSTSLACEDWYITAMYNKERRIVQTTSENIQWKDQCLKTINENIDDKHLKPKIA